MIVEIVGPPAAGKSTVTTFLKDELKRPIVEKGDRITGEWPRFQDEYPLAWEEYAAQHYTYTPDFGKDNAEFRTIVMQKSLERFKLFMRYRNFDGLFLWNRGITQVPIDAGMFSNKYSAYWYKSLCADFPRPDLVVHVFVPEHVGWERYIARKAYRRSKRKGNKFSAPMLREKYHERWQRFQKLIEPDVVLDNTKTVLGTDRWEGLVRHLDN